MSKRDSNTVRKCPRQYLGLLTDLEVIIQKRIIKSKFPVPELGTGQATKLRAALIRYIKAGTRQANNNLRSYYNGTL